MAEENDFKKLSVKSSASAATVARCAADAAKCAADAAKCAADAAKCAADAISAELGEAGD